MGSYRWTLRSERGNTGSDWWTLGTAGGSWVLLKDAEARMIAAEVLQVYATVQMGVRFVQLGSTEGCWDPTGGCWDPTSGGYVPNRRTFGSTSERWVRVLDDGSDWWTLRSERMHVGSDW